MNAESKDISGACARALTYVAEQSNATLHIFLARCAWELLYCAPEGTADIALALRNEEGRIVVGHAREQRALPLESLKGLVGEHERRATQVFVKDHALDCSSYAAAAPRSSLSLRFAAPRRIAPRGECFMWMGLFAVANPKIVSEGRGMSEEITRWLSHNEGLLLRIFQSCIQVREMEVRERELLALLHDVRAPLGAIKYLLHEAGSPSGSEHMLRGSVVDTLVYVESLLASVNPGQAVPFERVDDQCNLVEVVRRVVSRVQIGDGPERVVLELSDPDLSAVGRIPALELERVVGNILGNALKYGGATKVWVGVRVDSARIVLIVRDEGPGIDRQVLSQLSEGAPKTLAGARGWGVGLLSSRRRLERYGGDLCINSAPGAGTTVEMSVPRVQPGAARVKQSGLMGESSQHGCAEVPRHAEPEVSVAEPAPPHYGALGGEEPLVDECGAADTVVAPKANSTPPAQAEDLFIVDDDPDQISALSRVLEQRGLAVRGFTTVRAAVEAIRLNPPRAVLCDVAMPDGGVIRLLDLLKHAGAQPAVAVVSGDDSEELLYRCAAVGAREFFSKPLDLDGLVTWFQAQEGSSGV
jgi:signal transduction histidine kinase/CheY-like chemotaxis protein